ncbi:serine hydrolase domain-containing protein [Galbibacter sp.]|uniref:serine hydrolase domain-containing protein n=1 Tax=Galbibacter sp. TaxID=2918471 RepID=UPI003A8FC7CA
MKVSTAFSLICLLFCSFTLLGQRSDSSSCVLLNNDAGTIPIENLEDARIAYINLSDQNLDAFQNTLQKYTTITILNNDNFNISRLKAYNYIIYALSGHNINWELLYELTKLSVDTHVIAVSFEALEHYSFNDYLFDSDVLFQLENNTLANQLQAGSLIFGGSSCSGTLKNPVSSIFDKGSGLKIVDPVRLGYALPEMEGLNSEYINKKVDSIMNTAIAEQAFPGAQLLVAKNNSIIYHKSFGFYTYDSLHAVTNNDLYDLASVTKISGPLPILMQLVDQGKIDLDEKFSTYWKDWRHREDKKKLTVREVLAHQAGLQPYYVFVNEVMKDGKFKRRFVRTEPSRRFPTQIYDGLYINKNFPKKMYRILNRSKVSPIKKYKYSGLSFMLYPKMIQEMTGISYEDYLLDSIYKPLGATNLMFNPKGKYPDSLIVPTEVDTIFRNTLVKSWVHDENAGLLGGVSGNAGLFGTAEDLAKLMFMYQSMGVYAGKRFISEKTLKEFTSVQYPENDNKRGLGFDKPLLGNAELDISKASPAPEVSPESFGHGGFTGTYIWADPVHNILFIFLSNRVYPNRSHSNIYKLNVRPSLQRVFYKAKSVN